MRWLPAKVQPYRSACCFTRSSCLSACPQHTHKHTHPDWTRVGHWQDSLFPTAPFWCSCQLWQWRVCVCKVLFYMSSYDSLFVELICTLNQSVWASILRSSCSGGIGSAGERVLIFKLLGAVRTSDSHSRISRLKELMTMFSWCFLENLKIQCYQLNQSSSVFIVRFESFNGK